MSSEHTRRLRRQFVQRRGSKPSRCKLCKTTWLYGKNMMRGVCDKCAKIALNRNAWLMLARGRPGVIEARWSKGDWPGILYVRFAPAWGYNADYALPYEIIRDTKAGIVFLVDEEFERIKQGMVQDEHITELD